MNLFFLFGFFLISTMIAAEKQAANLLIGPDLYVDSERWMKYAEGDKNSFQNYSISFEDKPFIQKVLRPVVNDNSSLPTNKSMFVMNMFKDCIETRSTNVGDKILSIVDKEIGNCLEKSKFFIAELCAIQFYKFVTLFQLGVGEHIQIHYERREPSALFRRHKEDSLGDNFFNRVFYQGVFLKAMVSFDRFKAEQIVNMTKQLDIEMKQLAYNSSYNIRMIILFDKYLHSLNELFENELFETKARL